MAAHIRDVLERPSTPVEDSGHDPSPAPTGRPARSPPERMSGAWRRPSGRPCSVAAICADRGNASRQICIGVRPLLASRPPIRCAAVPAREPSIGRDGCGRSSTRACDLAPDGEGGRFDVMGACSGRRLAALQLRLTCAHYSGRWLVPECGTVASGRSSPPKTAVASPSGTRR
jgi:hypothetical protein